MNETIDTYYEAEVNNASEEYDNDIQEMMEDLWQCPECGVFFTLEEFEEQHCGCCGWPDDDESEWDDDDFDYEQIS
jgi:rubrerythrin